ncbi:MAG: peptidoglycan-associated lipoprotein Pal [Bdellovibrionales bacterium]
MKKNALTILAVTAAVILTSACGSKKKSGDGVNVGGNPDAGIAAKEMAFDAAGSDSGTIAGLSTIFFEYDQANITTAARRQLAANAEWIKNNTNVAVQVEGHCDARGTVEYNIALGERRALAVKNYLISLGIDGKRLSVISYGKERPMVQGDSEDAYGKNRRANFVPVPK